MHLPNIEGYWAGVVAIGAVIALVVALSVIFPVANSPGTDSNSVFLQTQSQKNGVPEEQKSGQIDKSSFHKAPELAGISGYINADSNISVANLKGKVILLDFWTYTCINCIRTLPYLNDWQSKYADKGLVIIGVHTPEFDFEKERENVSKAVEKYGVKFPVVQDNGYATWRAYGNHYWPHKYLVDSEGYIRYDHVGEGGYGETEDRIVGLLNERDKMLKLENKNEMNVPAPEFKKIGTPEIYLGYGFARAPLGNPEGFRPGEVVSYSFSNAAYDTPNIVSLEGKWENKRDSVKLVSDKGRLVLFFEAKNVNIVAGNMDSNSSVRAEVNGFTMEERPNERGADAVLQDGNYFVPVKNQKLYNIVALEDYDKRGLVLEITGNGFELYTFTFG